MSGGSLRSPSDWGLAHRSFFFFFYYFLFFFLLKKKKLNPTSKFYLTFLFQIFSGQRGRNPLSMQQLKENGDGEGMGMEMGMRVVLAQETTSKRVATLAQPPSH